MAGRHSTTTGTEALWEMLFLPRKSFLIHSQHINCFIDQHRKTWLTQKDPGEKVYVDLCHLWRCVRGCADVCTDVCLLVKMYGLAVHPNPTRLMGTVVQRQSEVSPTGRCTFKLHVWNQMFYWRGWLWECVQTWQTFECAINHSLLHNDSQAHGNYLYAWSPVTNTNTIPDMIFIVSF